MEGAEEKGCLAKFCCQKPKWSNYVGTVTDEEETFENISLSLVGCGAFFCYGLCFNCIPVWCCGIVDKMHFLDSEYHYKDSQKCANVGEKFAFGCCIPWHVICCCWICAGICRVTNQI